MRVLARLLLLGKHLLLLLLLPECVVLLAQFLLPLLLGSALCQVQQQPLALLLLRLSLWLLPRLVLVLAAAVLWQARQLLTACHCCEGLWWKAAPAPAPAALQILRAPGPLPGCSPCCR
jgi:hypothetical protein